MSKKNVALAILLVVLNAITVINAQKQKDPAINPYVTNTQEAIANGILDRCGIEAILERIYNDPVLLKQYEDNKKPLNESRFEFNRITCTAANTVNVPLAFHFDNSFSCANAACILSEIQDAIATLNIDFGNNTGSPNAANCPAAYPDISTGSCINFYLAAPPACSGLDVACDGAITIGQFQGGYNATGGNGAGNCWDDYLNVFVQSPQANNLGVSDQIPGYLNAAGPGEGVSLGAPYFGGNGGPCAPFDTDATYNGGSTLAHEIGHYLGLPHIWGDVNGGGCGGDDGFADTPNQAQQYFGCPTGCVASGCGGPQQTANFMNYTNDNCMDLFTEDQAATMNFYANQFFGGLNIPPANPAELYAQCTGNPCVITCPAVATSTYSDTDEVCAANGTYSLPATYPGLTLDDPAGATYTWSSGAYLPGGTAVTGGSYNLTNPSGCNPSTEILYLNVSCATDNSININGGTLVLSIYPDPSQFVATDLAAVSGENTCNEPILTPLCPEVTITGDATNPAFPVAAGQSGTANYTVTYTPAAGAPNCCSSGGGAGSELITNGDFEAGSNGWTETEEVPSGTPNPNPFGIIGVSNSPVNGSTDAWFGGWGGTSTLTISQNITIPATCAEANLTFDFSMSCAGDAGITLDVVVNGVVLGTLSCADGASGTITPFDLIAAGAPTGNVTISFVGTEDGTGTGEPDIYLDNISVVTANCAVATTCDFSITANYNCAGCTNCNNASCTTTQACNDNDPCTANDQETILSSDSSICVPCAGTAIASCSGSTSVVACNDFDACTTNDVQTVDDCDGSICVPCAGTVIASCSGSTSVVACNDFDACTTNDVQTVDDCNGSICVPCAGTVIASCSGSTNTVSCNDGNPCTTGDVRVVDACDGSVCVPCAGTVNVSSCAAACSTTQTCNDGNPCTTNDQETVATDGSVCVPCAGTLNASSCNAACTTTQSCNDNNPCTTNDIVILASNGSVCVPCAGTLNTASCNAACTTTQSCNDGDACTTNDQITLAANGSVCAPCAGTINTTSCNATCTTTQSCNDNNPCTTNDIVILAANGSVCTPCAGTLNTNSCNAACTTTQSCNDNNPCSTNDVVILAANGSVCAPCIGTVNSSSCNAACTTIQACDDGDDCTINDQVTIAASGAICTPCAGILEPSACCSNVNMSIFFDGFPGQTSWDITDSNGNVVANSGLYSGQSPNSQMNIAPAVCLSDGCYILNFYDSLNNGMCPFQSSAVGVSTFITPGTLISPGSIVGTLSLVATPGLCGNYNLTDANGTSLASGGGSFGSQQITTFCLNNGLAPKYDHDTNPEFIDKFIRKDIDTPLVDLMPNPVYNIMTVNHHFKSTVDVQVIDVVGRVLATNDIVQLSQSAFRLDVGDLEPGVYFIQINANEGLATKKFIKE